MNPAQRILIFCVQLYRWFISPAKLFLFGPLARCRFTPSCSAYALQAIQTHGAMRGTLLAVKRLFRCHPWGGCGEDLVPPVKSEACCCHTAAQKSFDGRPVINTQLQLGVSVLPRFLNRFNGLQRSKNIRAHI